MVTKNRPTHPGVLFNLDVLEPQGKLIREEDLSDETVAYLMELSTRTGIGMMTLRNVFLGKAPVTMDTAKGLAALSNTSAISWYDMQVNYDRWELTAKEGEMQLSTPETPGQSATLVDFRAKVESLINSMCLENGSNTPDFILAEYLADCLETFDKAVIRRERWYGRLTNTAE